MEKERCLALARITEQIVATRSWGLGRYAFLRKTWIADARSIRPPPDYQYYKFHTATQALVDKIFTSCCKCFFAFCGKKQPRCRSPPMSFQIYTKFERMLKMIGYKDFDYYLWTTEDGKNMVKVKATGEVAEIPKELMRYLRSIEKQEARQVQEKSMKLSTGVTVTEVSLDTLDGSGCHRTLDIPAPDNVEEMVYTKILIEQTIKDMTTAQKNVFKVCMCQGATCRQYSAKNGIRKSTVHDIIKVIRKKIEKNL